MALFEAFPRIERQVSLRMPGTIPKSAGLSFFTTHCTMPVRSRRTMNFTLARSRISCAHPWTSTSSPALMSLRGVLSMPAAGAGGILKLCVGWPGPEAGEGGGRQ